MCTEAGRGAGKLEAGAKRALRPAPEAWVRLGLTGNAWRSDISGLREWGQLEARRQRSGERWAFRTVIWGR